MLSGAQLGITVTGLPVGYVAEPLIGESLGVERLVPSRVRLELPDAAPAPPTSDVLRRLFPQPGTTAA